jgi:hypothetical protein
MENTLALKPFSRDEILGERGTVWNTEMKKYARLVDDLVEELGEGMSKEEIHDLANFFISVTSIHNQLGDSQTRSMVVSEFFVSKVYSERPGHVSKLDQNLLVSLMLAVTPRFPLIIQSETAEIFSDIKQRKIWENFQQEIMRQYTTPNWFDPKSFETSTGF